VAALRDDLLERAHRSGRHVAETLNGPPEEATYIGEPGMCPVCHSKVLEIRNGDDNYPTICGICGVKGTLQVVDGKVRFEVPEEERVHSHVLLSGKFEHLDELADRSLVWPANKDDLPKKIGKYKGYLAYSRPERRPPAR
jgi:hypothetical protein